MASAVSSQVKAGYEMPARSCPLRGAVAVDSGGDSGTGERPGGLSAPTRTIQKCCKDVREGPSGLQGKIAGTALKHSRKRSLACLKP